MMSFLVCKLIFKLYFKIKRRIKSWIKKNFLKENGTEDFILNLQDTHFSCIV